MEFPTSHHEQSENPELQAVQNAAHETIAALYEQNPEAFMAAYGIGKRIQPHENATRVFNHMQKMNQLGREGEPEVTSRIHAAAFMLGAASRTQGERI
jgi:hypothetical protein